MLEQSAGPIIAASDYTKSWPDMIAQWSPRSFTALGTDGFGMSDTRSALRRHFEVDAEHVAFAALWRLSRTGGFPPEKLAAALKELGIDPEQGDPASA